MICLQNWVKQHRYKTLKNGKWQNQQILHVLKSNQNRNVPVEIHWHFWVARNVLVKLMLTSESGSDNDGVMIVIVMIVLVASGTDL